MAYLRPPARDSVLRVSVHVAPESLRKLSDNWFVVVKGDDQR
jgi:hypothetical protein